MSAAISSLILSVSLQPQQHANRLVLFSVPLVRCLRPSSAPSRFSQLTYFTRKRPCIIDIAIGQDYQLACEHQAWI